MDPRHQPQLQSPSGARPIHSQRTSLPDMRSHNEFASTNGPLPVPNRPPGINGNGQMYSSRGGPQASNGMSKSPPNTPSQKNTKHVPCKFFYKGQCAAGDTCPYSHNLEPPEPCKFFLNGNCKYGNSCALPHYNSNGVLLNPQCFTPYRRPRRQMTGGNRPPPLGLNGPTSHSMSMFPQAPHTASADRSMAYPQEFGEFGSPTNSNFSSPAFEAQLGRSPPFRTALDTPLPPSFSSQDLPNIQKFGQHAMSVPAKGGLGPLTNNSPTTSVASHEAFANLDSALNEKLDLGSSPPNETRAEVAPRKIVPNGRSLMHSDLPSSMPVRDRGELLRALERRQQPEVENHEEDYLPQALSDLLTPQEKMRRFSRPQDEPHVTGRPSHSSLVGSPNSKVGSPSGASPSRFSGFFAERARREAEAAGTQMGSSPFGHVGSPLRNSAFSSHARKQAEMGGHSPSFGPISPPGSQDRPAGVSSLSEQLRMARNPTANEGMASQQQLSAPQPIGTSRAMGTGGMTARRERVMSTGSGVAPERIEEEDACFFSMEDDDEMRRRKEASGRSSLSNDL